MLASPVVLPVPPCAFESGVVKPVSEVISEFTPLLAAPKLALAVVASLAPVPPSVIARSVMPVILPPVIATEAGLYCL